MKLLTEMMTKRFYLIIIFLFVGVLVNTTSAQTTDLKARVSTGLQKDITKKLSASIEYEHRFDQQLTALDKAFFEPSVDYEIYEKLKFGIAYRAILDQNKSRNRKAEQRVSSFFKYGIDVNDFEIKLKTAIQYGFEEISNASFQYDQKLVNRNAVEVEYNWFGKKITPFVGYEIFYHINHPNGGIINQWRLKLGADYKISKSSKVVIYYLFENEFNVVQPLDAHVIGIGYRYKL